MKNSPKEIEEIMKSQRIHTARMKQENILKANEILAKILASNCANEVSLVVKTVRVNSYE